MSDPDFSVKKKRTKKGNQKKQQIRDQVQAAHTDIIRRHVEECIKDNRVMLPLNIDGQKVGKPKQYVDEMSVFNLAIIGCSKTEIAAILGCSEDRLREHHQLVELGHQMLARNIRAAQVKVALAGDTTMLKHLGKYILNQTDKEQPLVNVIQNFNKEYEQYSDEDLLDILEHDDD